MPKRPQISPPVTARPGEIAQWDLWEPPVDIPLGYDQAARLQVLVGVPCFSRYILAELIGTKSSEDVLCGHLRLIVEFGYVPPLEGLDTPGPPVSGRDLVVPRTEPRLHALLLLTPTTGSARSGTPGSSAQATKELLTGLLRPGVPQATVMPAPQWRAEGGGAVRAKDELSRRNKAPLERSYDFVDRVVLNAYMPPSHSPGGFRSWCGAGTRARTPPWTTPT